jgi:hypothetical protein
MIQPGTIQPTKIQHSLKYKGGGTGRIDHPSQKNPGANLAPKKKPPTEDRVSGSVRVKKKAE